VSRDRWEPKLRVRASGLGGSGYALVTRPDADGKPQIVPGVTTCLGALDKPGVLQWSIDNVAAYATANVDRLLSRTEEQGFGFLRFYHKRMKEADFDNPDIDIRDYSNGVLNDLAELGTITHDWVADFVNGYFEPDITRDEQAEMIAEFVDWWNAHDVEVLETEVSVVIASENGDLSAGTLDHIWIVDGVPTLIDLKTSRKTRAEHYAQAAALGAAQSILREVSPGTEGAVEYETKRWGKTYWIEEPLPAFSEFAILHLRPSDTDNEGNYMAPFCRLEKISEAKIAAGWKLYQASLSARLAQKEMKEAERDDE
jgi:hypothetical protein